LKPFAGCPWIEYTGYVSETSIPSLFRPMSIVVLPYSSATGPSGVAHLACEHAVPMIASDLPDFHEMAEAEGMAIDFFPTDDAKNLTDTMYRLLTSPDRQREMAEQNFAAALKMTMPAIIGQYRGTFSEHMRKNTGQSSRWRSTFRSLRSMLYGEPLSSGNEP
jgi:glycosyltransferase involved in cell wall biosynthesis